MRRIRSYVVVATIAGAVLPSAGHADVVARNFGSVGAYNATAAALVETVVPEPASLALVATGLLGLGLVTRRRRKG